MGLSGKPIQTRASHLGTNVVFYYFLRTDKGQKNPSDGLKIEKLYTVLQAFTSPQKNNALTAVISLTAAKIPLTAVKIPLTAVKFSY